MTQADEISEQSVMIEIAGKQRDPLAAGEIATLPIGAALRIQRRLEEALVGRHIGGLIGLAEEPVERIVVGKLCGGGQFQPR